MATHTSRQGVPVEAFKIPVGAVVTLDLPPTAQGFAPPTRAVPARTGDWLVTFPSGEVVVLPAAAFGLLFGPTAPGPP